MKGISWIWEKCIEKDEFSNALAHSVGDKLYDEAGVAVPDQHKVSEIFILNQIHDIGDVGIKVDALRRKMLAFT